MSSRKRKPDEDGDEMVLSPQSSPSPHVRHLRPAKKIRTNETFGRSLALPRLLETLDSEQLRIALQRICERHPTIGHEVVAEAPRPTVTAALNVIHQYKEKLNAAIPYGETSAEYTYYRIKQPLIALIDALLDFTPQFLPPIETQTATSLQYLDGATAIIHALPNWEPQSYRHHKDFAYDEISRAWSLVIQEAAKRGGGFHLHTGGWDQTLANHNDESGGKLAAAMDALATSLGWMTTNPSLPLSASPNATGGSDPSSRFDQLISGALGPAAVRVGRY